jgi:hypothetical protein
MEEQTVEGCGEQNCGGAEIQRWIDLATALRSR